MKKLDMINEKLSKGREKLEEIKKQYDVDSKKITELIQKRANLLADEAIEPNSQKKAEIKKVNEELESLKKSIEGKPELINAVGEKLKNIEIEKRDEELRLSFERQKIVGKSVVELSKNLIEGLESCRLINDDLRKFWTEYANLCKVTKKGAIKSGSKTTQGSFECLRSLVGVLSYEYNQGKPRPSDQTRIMQW